MIYEVGKSTAHMAELTNTRNYSTLRQEFVCHMGRKRETKTQNNKKQSITKCSYLQMYETISEQLEYTTHH